MSQTTITAEGAFTDVIRGEVNGNFDELYASGFYGNRLIIHSSGATPADAFTAATHDGKVFVNTRTAGVTVTLPAAEGTGARFIIVNRADLSGNMVVQVTGDDKFIGCLMGISTGDTPDLAQPWAAGASDDTVTLNGTTSGGEGGAGDIIEVIDVAVNIWLIDGRIFQSGTEVTPFSSVVS